MPCWQPRSPRRVRSGLSTPGRGGFGFVLLATPPRAEVGEGVPGWDGPTSSSGVDSDDADKPVVQLFDPDTGLGGDDG